MRDQITGQSVYINAILNYFLSSLRPSWKLGELNDVRGVELLPKMVQKIANNQCLYALSGMNSAPRTEYNSEYEDYYDNKY